MADKDTPKAPQDGNDDDDSMVGRLRSQSAAPKPPETPVPKTSPGASDDAAPKGKAPATSGASQRNRSSFAPPPGMPAFAAPTPVLVLGFLDCAGFHSILECDYNLPDHLLRSQYQRRSRQVHPDKNPNDPYANEKFALLNEAFNTF